MHFLCILVPAQFWIFSISDVWFSVLELYSLRSDKSKQSLSFFRCWQICFVFFAHFYQKSILLDFKIKYFSDGTTRTAWVTYWKFTIGRETHKKPNLLVKSKRKISSNYVAFSKNTNSKYILNNYHKNYPRLGRRGLELVCPASVE